MMMTATPADRPTAFLSVWDKTGLEPFARYLQEHCGYRLIATGGTRTHLLEAGLTVDDLSEITGFVELLEGRVKSLHPEVFAGILAKRHRADHMSQIKTPLDMVVVNLYPFEAGLQQTPALSEAEMVELIDIGGVSLLRAAAKNFNDVTVVSSPHLYEAICLELKLNNGRTSLGLRQRLALTAFERTQAYDSAISGWLMNTLATTVASEETDAVALPNALTPSLHLTLHQVQDMRYGENPHQPAALYALDPNRVDITPLHGKALSYNNILDMEAAWALISEFTAEPTVAIIKHTQPCGVAQAPTLCEAYQRALDCDPLSAFGGIVACNQRVDEATAKQMVNLFLEVIVAPGFTPEAVDVLTTKKNLRLVVRPWQSDADTRHPAAQRDGAYVRQVSSNLFLVQEQCFEATQQQLEGNLKVVTKTKPTKEQLKEASFAWKVVKHLKSNGIVISKNQQAIGLCGGATSRVGAVERALAMACDSTSGAVLASDGFFPAVDNIQVAAQNRVGCIIQPGGSIKDAAIIEACDKYGIAMLTTSVREFKH